MGTQQFLVYITRRGPEQHSGHEFTFLYGASFISMQKCLFHPCAQKQLSSIFKAVPKSRDPKILPIG